MATPMSQDIIDSLRLSWANGTPLKLQKIFNRNPNLALDPALAVDIIYTEVLLREGNGEHPSEDEYIEQFPSLREPISRQFQLHRALKDIGNNEHNSETLNSSLNPTPPIDATSVTSVPSIPGFEIRSIAGRGGMGTAFRAFDIRLKRDVAIKVLQLSSEQSHEQLLREAEAAASLQHPGIVHVYQIGEHHGSPFLVMEFIEGESLSQRLKKEPLPTDLAIRLTEQITHAVAFAHDEGIVHRDLKPGNILLNSDGKPHVCDFGLARHFDAEQTLQTGGDIVGTPAYMPPEQARGETVTFTADIYSLGATLYHSVTGRPPFQAANRWEILNQVLTEDPVPARTLNPAISKDLDTVISRAIHKNPNRRFSSAAEFGNELARLRDGKPIVSRPAGAAERFWKLCRRNPLNASISAIAAAALVIVAIVSYFSKQVVGQALQQTQIALDEAKTQRDVALDAMHKLVFQVNNDLSRKSATIEARESVLSVANDGLEKIVKTNGLTDDTIALYSTALVEYGYILVQVGKDEKATQQYEKAIQISSRSDSRVAQQNHASSYNFLSRHYIRLAESEKALDASEKAVDLSAKICKEHPELVSNQLIQCAALNNHASSLAALGRGDEAVPHALKAQALLRAILAKEPENRHASRVLIDVNLELAILMFSRQRNADAEAALNEVLVRIEVDELSIEDDFQLFKKFVSALELSSITSLRKMDYASALEKSSKATKLRLQISADQPLLPGDQIKVSTAADKLSMIQFAMGDLDESSKNCGIALDHIIRAMELGGDNYRVQRVHAGNLLARFSDIQLRQGHCEQSIESLMQLIKMLEPIAEEFQMQALIDKVAYQAELVKAATGQDSSASKVDAEMVTRSYTAWKQLIAGDDSLFNESKPQMIRDIANASRPEFKVALAVGLSTCDALLYRMAIQDGDPKKISLAYADTIQSIELARQINGCDPTFFLYLPEFVKLRESDAFKAAFPVK